MRFQSEFEKVLSLRMLLQIERSLYHFLKRKILETWKKRGSSLTCLGFKHFYWASESMQSIAYGFKRDDSNRRTQTEAKTANNSNEL